MTQSAEQAKADHHLERRSSLYSKIEPISRVLRYLATLLHCLALREKQLYELLPHGDSIRLLQIHPGSSSQPIVCSLHLARLDKDLPSYEALSYVWSLKEGFRTITVNGQAKSDVTTNLYECLQSLRSEKKSRLMWVDALCMNQGDNKEKAKQVRRMHHIYRRASQVIVWLGTDSQNVAYEAFGVLCTLVNDKAKDKAKELGKSRMASYQFLEWNVGKEVEIPEQIPLLADDVWKKVLRFFNNTWFLRMWVMQEIVLAKSAKVIFGDASIDWSIIATATHIIRSRSHLHSMLETRTFQNAFLMHYLRTMQEKNEMNDSNGVRFLYLLDTARSFDVGDPRDKVYGLLGFPTRGTSKETGLFITPDYTISFPEVFTRVARKILEKDGCLDMLSFVVHAEDGETAAKMAPQNDDDQKDMKMPSWVPDWTCKDVIYPFIMFPPDSQHQAGTSQPLSISCTDDPRVLRLKGVIVDKVRETGPIGPFVQFHESAVVLRALVEWCLQWPVDATTLAQTLTGGRDADANLISDPEQHLADFMALLLHPDFGLSIPLSSVWPAAASSLITLVASKGEPDRAKEALWRYSCYRAPFVTEQGRLGLGPRAARKGDMVVVLWGGQVVYTLREGKDRNEQEDMDERKWDFVGEAYVEDFMLGEVDKLLDKGDREERMFEIR